MLWYLEHDVTGAVVRSLNYCLLNGLKATNIETPTGNLHLDLLTLEDIREVREDLC